MEGVKKSSVIEGTHLPITLKIGKLGYPLSLSLSLSLSIYLFIAEEFSLSIYSLQRNKLTEIRSNNNGLICTTKKNCEWGGGGNVSLSMQCRLTTTCGRKYSLLKNGPTPASFSFIFGLFKQTLQLFVTNKCEKCQIHPVYGAWIRTHDLSIMSCLP